MIFVVMNMIIVVVATMRMGGEIFVDDDNNNKTKKQNNNNIIRLQKVRTNGDHKKQQIRCISITFIPTTRGFQVM